MPTASNSNDGDVLRGMMTAANAVVDLLACCVVVVVTAVQLRCAVFFYAMQCLTFSFVCGVFQILLFFFAFFVVFCGFWVINP